MPVTKKEVESYIELVEMGHLSLWFLSTALQSANHDRTVRDIYTNTIGTLPNASTPVFNQGTCLMAGYLLMVVPKEANLKAFAAHLITGTPLDLSKFVLRDGNGNPWTKTLDVTLNKLRNSIAHANYEAIPSTSKIKLWNHKDATTIDFSAEVELHDFAAFCEEYKRRWVEWANSLP